MSNFLQVCFLLFESIAQVTYVFIGVKLEKQKQDHLRTCHQATAITPGGPCPPPNCPLFDDLTWTTSGPQEAPPYPCFPGQEYDSQSRFSNYRESKRSPWMFPLKSALSGPDMMEAALHPTPRGPCTVFPREFLLIFNLFPHSDLASHP